MIFGQLIYTASKYNIRDTEGFGIYSYTKDLYDVRDEIARLCDYKCDSYIYKKLSNGIFVFLKKTGIGTDYSGRSGNYFVHALTNAEFSCNPFCFNDWFVSRLTEEQKQNEQVDFLDCILVEPSQCDVDNQYDLKEVYAVIKAIAYNSKERIVIRCSTEKAKAIIAGLYKYIPYIAANTEFEIGVSGTLRTTIAFDVNNLLTKGEIEGKYRGILLDLNNSKTSEFIIGYENHFVELKTVDALKQCIDIICDSIDFETVTYAETKEYMKSSVSDVYVEALCRKVDFWNTQNNEIDVILKLINADRDMSQYIIIRALKKRYQNKALSDLEESTLRKKNDVLPSINMYEINSKMIKNFVDYRDTEKKLIADKVIKQNVKVKDLNNLSKIITFYFKDNEDISKGIDYLKNLGVKDKKICKLFKGILENLKKQKALQTVVLESSLDKISDYVLKNISKYVVGIDDKELINMYLNNLLIKNIDLSENCYDDVLVYALDRNIDFIIKKKCGPDDDNRLKVSVINNMYEKSQRETVL